jgi:hypothetical protein
MAPKSSLKRQSSTLETTPEGAAAKARKKGFKRPNAVNWSTGVSSIAEANKLFLTSKGSALAGIFASTLHYRMLNQLVALRGQEHKAKDTEHSLKKDKAPLREGAKSLKAVILLSCPHFQSSLVTLMLKGQEEAMAKYDASLEKKAASEEEE